MSATLLESARGGDRAALSRALSEIEHLAPAAAELLAGSVAAEPRVIGWTGAPGAGKSTLLAALLELRVARGIRAAVLAVDPTSPITGGSVLGDRIRMESLALNASVFIRSLPSRLRRSAIAPATMRMARFLAFAGYGEIHVETVGVGQSDIAVAELADTTVLVAGPNAGDGIQGLKAGILEVADIFAVSKCDIEGAARAATHLETAATPRPSGWVPPIVLTSATASTGIEELSAEIDRHHAGLGSSGALAAHRRSRRAAELRAACATILEEELDAGGALGSLRARVEAGEIDPALAAEEIRGRMTK